MAVEPENLVLAALLLVVAALYSSVGQAGASGYLAAMALVGVEPEVMKPAALVLNENVAADRYPHVHSDIAALMVFEHQVGMFNRLARGGTDRANAKWLDHRCHRRCSLPRACNPRWGYPD